MPGKTMPDEQMVRLKRCGAAEAASDGRVTMARPASATATDDMPARRNDSFVMQLPHRWLAVTPRDRRDRRNRDGDSPGAAGSDRYDRNLRSQPVTEEPECSQASRPPRTSSLRS